jgi:HSP90 family molecular chaperone
MGQITNVEEAKAQISKEFIDKFYEFLEDVKTMDVIHVGEFGKKYGILLRDEAARVKHSKDTQTNLLWFQSNIFSGRWSQAWEKVGYDRQVIYELHKAGFLSLQEYYSSMARASGRTCFYYINQANAKLIYKAYKESQKVG